MATCCIPYVICPSVLKLPLATSVPYRNPAAPTMADGIVLGGGGWEGRSSLAPLTPDLESIYQDEWKPSQLEETTQMLY